MTEGSSSKVALFATAGGALGAAALLFAIIVLKSPIASSYWLDETITAWVVRDGFVSTFARAWNYQGESPLYFLLARLMYVTAGLAGMRLLSVLLTIGSAWLLFKIAARWWGREGGAYAALAFVVLDGVVRISFTARPYALALFFALGSVYCLERWIERAARRDGWWYLATLLLCFYSHYLFGGIVAVHALQLWSARDKAAAITSAWLKLLPIAAVAAFPGVFQLYWLSHHGAGLSFAGRPTGKALLRTLFPVDYFVYLVCAVALARIAGPFGFKMPRGRIALLAAWWIVPPCAFWLAAQLVGGGSLFVDRLFLWFQPALALFAAMLFVAMENRKVRAVALAAFTAMALMRQVGRVWYLEDWRGAAELASASAPQKAPVLAFTGLIEADSLDWLHDPARREYLSAPFVLYPILSPVVLVPGGFATEPAQQYFKDVITPVITEQPEFTLIALHIRRFPAGESSFFADEALSSYLQKLGYRVEQLTDGDDLVRVFKVKSPVSIPTVS